VEHQVHVRAASNVVDTFSPIGCSVVDRHRSPELGGEFPLLDGAGRADNTRTRVPRELHQQATEGPTRRLDEYPLADRRPRSPSQADGGPTVSDERGGDEGVQAVRDWHAIVYAGGDELGVSAREGRGDDSGSHKACIHAGAHVSHNASDAAAGNVRNVWAPPR